MVRVDDNQVGYGDQSYGRENIESLKRLGRPFRTRVMDIGKLYREGRRFFLLWRQEGYVQVTGPL